MRPISPNRITQKAHGTTRAVDYSAKPDPYVYAPEDLIFDSYQQRGSGKEDAGMALRARGASGLHQWGHLEASYFPSGKAKKGERIAKMGHTGYTIPEGPGGAHCHYWLQTGKGYVYPPDLINEPFGSEGSEPMFNEGDRVNLNNMLYGQDNGFFGEFIGKPWKETMYGILGGDIFRFHYHVNDGDVANINAALGRTDGGEALGKSWKTAAYQYFLTRPPVQDSSARVAELEQENAALRKQLEFGSNNFLAYEIPQLFVKKKGVL